MRGRRRTVRGQTLQHATHQQDMIRIEPVCAGMAFCQRVQLCERGACIARPTARLKMIDVRIEGFCVGGSVESLEQRTGPLERVGGFGRSAHREQHRTTQVGCHRVRD